MPNLRQQVLCYLWPNAVNLGSTATLTNGNLVYGFEVAARSLDDGVHSSGLQPAVTHDVIDREALKGCRGSENLILC
jgi:hypothetical protein